MHFPPPPLRPVPSRFSFSFVFALVGFEFVFFVVDGSSDTESQVAPQLARELGGPFYGPFLRPFILEPPGFSTLPLARGFPCENRFLPLFLSLPGHDCRRCCAAFFFMSGAYLLKLLVGTITTLVFVLRKYSQGPFFRSRSLAELFPFCTGRGPCQHSLFSPSL